jgi:hypothetical protein
MLIRSSRIARIALIGLIALALAVDTSLPAIADDDRGDEAEIDSPSDVGTLAFVTPPTGFAVIYFFTGARTTSTVATTVHCTNIGGPTTQVRVEFYDFAGILRGVGTDSVVAQYQTTTISGNPTGSTAFYNEDVFAPLSGPLDQGVVRVLKKGTGEIICIAQVLDAFNSPPSFVISLPHFLPGGAH